MTQRSAFVLRVKPDKIDDYVEAHHDVWPEMLQALHDAGIRNYSIFLRDGLLFSYFEYTGDDLDADLAAIAEDEDTKRWWTLTDPCQEPVATAAPGEWWAPMEQVFHDDGAT